jgi:hypothetical protein
MANAFLANLGHLIFKMLYSGGAPLRVAPW